MSSRLRKSPLAALALLAALAFSACGNAHTRVTTGTYAGESGAGAPYLNVGPLVYEVQISRQLNPVDTEDASYLSGLAPAERRLAPGQEWFAVFVQVYNHNSVELPAASSMLVTDTQGNVYTPLIPDQTNVFAYRAGMVPAKGQVPVPDTIAASGPTQGALLLYKVKILSLDNRPWKLTIANPGDPAETASAELDV
jgi:hypothetical protein